MKTPGWAVVHNGTGLVALQSVSTNRFRAESVMKSYLASLDGEAREEAAENLKVVRVKVEVDKAKLRGEQ